MIVKEIVDYIGSLEYPCKVCVNDDKQNIEGFSSLNNYKKNTFTWVKKQENIMDKQLDSVPLIIAQEGCNIEGINVIYSRYSKNIFFNIIEHFYDVEKKNTINTDSIIETSNIGNNVNIGHNCFIGKDVFIEDNVYIHNNVSIQCPCHIGMGTIIWSGVVIGTDGFGYYTTSTGKIEKVRHYGGVYIGENVEIGANTCIDRGTIDDTYIGNGTKIDNLCHIGHNVQIGENVQIIALSMLGGSSKVEDNGYIAPGSLVKNQISVRRKGYTGMGAVVVHDVEENTIVVGNPAKRLRERNSTE